MSHNLHWKVNLSVHISNSEMLLNHPKGPENRDYILDELVLTYLMYSIERALLEIREAWALVRKLDPKADSKNLPKLHQVLWYANKLVAHQEENLLKEEVMEVVRELKKSNWKILKDIPEAVNEMIPVIDKCSKASPTASGISVTLTSAVSIPVFDLDDLRQKQLQDP